jgi:hypothetical protein
MIEVRIYQPAKSAMQSGKANTRKWLLEFEPRQAKSADPLMGWIGSGDTRSQVRLKFDTKEGALAYAQRKGYTVRLQEPKTRRVPIRSYAENFRFDRPA